MKSETTFLSLFLALLCLATPASAHAFVDHAEPRVGSTIAQSPANVSIWFTQQPEAAFSRIEIFNADGNQVDSKDTHVDAKDPKELTISLPALPPGTYKVVWHVLSADTHKTQGDFKFTIQP